MGGCLCEWCGVDVCVYGDVCVRGWVSVCTVWCMVLMSVCKVLCMCGWVYFVVDVWVGFCVYFVVDVLVYV